MGLTLTDIKGNTIELSKDDTDSTVRYITVKFLPNVNSRLWKLWYSLFGESLSVTLSLHQKQTLTDFLFYLEYDNREDVLNRKPANMEPRKITEEERQSWIGTVCEVIDPQHYAYGENVVINEADGYGVYFTYDSKQWYILWDQVDWALEKIEGLRGEVKDEEYS